MNKNDIVKTEIYDLSDTGMGIGRADNMVVFVRGAVPGDILSARIVKVQKRIAYGIIEELTTPSSHRITPDCPHFLTCGGCALRNLDYRRETELKSKGVFETMRRIGGVEMAPEDILFSDSGRYRNKAQFPIGEKGAGFYALHSHRIVDIKNCLLLPREFSLAAEEFSRFLTQYNIPFYNEQTKKGLVRHLFLRKGEVSSEVQAAVVVFEDSMPHTEELINLFKTVFGDKLKSVALNINSMANNVILGDKTRVIYGAPYIADTLCGVKVRLSLNSFYQVNHKAAELLYKRAALYAEPEGKTVLDLYCGAGTIGLSMAKAAKRIIGVEIVPAAVEDAVYNARQNGIENAWFICADAEAAANTLKTEGIKPDVVILDPPRKGCSEELLNTVAEGFAPERIVYVSCDKATLARDVRILSQLGYNLKEYTTVDMFPRTAHVETVVLITRAGL